jgi:putative transposase
MISPLKVGIQYLLLDRGFFSVPVIRWLKALNIPFVMPAIIRGKQSGTRQLLKGRQSYATVYTLNSKLYGTVDCQMRVVCHYLKGRQGKHGIGYALYVVHRLKIALSALHQCYRERFGIETSYRIKNLCRIRTTTKNPVVRLLFVAIAFILVNLWVYLLWHVLSVTQRGGRVVYRNRFALKTMMEFLSHAIEKLFPPILAIYLPVSQ